MAFHTLPEEIQAILRAADEFGGELTEEQWSEFERLSGDSRNYVNYLTVVMNEARMQEGALNARAAQIRDRAKVHTRRYERTKKRIGETLAALRTDSLEADIYVVSLRKSPPAVAVDLDKFDVDKVDQQFVRVTKEPNLSALAALLKDGKPVPEGVTLTQGTYVHVGLK